jgi:hypothetical protein
MSNKMEITIKFKDENGNEEAVPITVEADIPSYEDFKKINNFREAFDLYERAVLKARKEATERATFHNIRILLSSYNQISS